MQIIFYFDIYPGLLTQHVYATQTPGAKGDNVKRYKVVLNIPDPNEPDEEITQADAVEVPDDKPKPPPIVVTAEKDGG